VQPEFEQFYRSMSQKRIKRFQQLGFIMLQLDGFTQYEPIKYNQLKEDFQVLLWEHINAQKQGRTGADEDTIANLLIEKFSPIMAKYMEAEEYYASLDFSSPRDSHQSLDDMSLVSDERTNISGELPLDHEAPHSVKTYDSDRLSHKSSACSSRNLGSRVDSELLDIQEAINLVPCCGNSNSETACLAVSLPETPELTRKDVDIPSISEMRVQASGELQPDPNIQIAGTPFNSTNEDIDTTESHQPNSSLRLFSPASFEREIEGFQHEIDELEEQIGSSFGAKVPPPNATDVNEGKNTKKNLKKIGARVGEKMHSFHKKLSKVVKFFKSN